MRMIFIARWAKPTLVSGRQWIASLTVGLAAIAVTPLSTAFAGQPAPSNLTPPPPSVYTCMGIGNADAAMCRSSATFTFSPDPNFPDGTCGSGTGSFDILEQG